MAIHNEICKLCLEKCETFKPIEENTKNAFDILLPKIDFTVIQGLAICKNCADMLIKCFNFKIKCLHTHDYIVTFINKDDAKLDLRDVYLSKNVTDTGIPEDEDVCGLCMGLVKNCSAVSLDVEVRHVALEKMLKQCLPKLDLSMIKKPVICAPCLESLEDCFRFETNSLIVEKRNKKYSEILDKNSEDQMEPNSLLQFKTNNVATREVDGNSVDIKVEQSCEDRKNPDERSIGKTGDLINLQQMRFDSEGANEDVESKNQSFMEFYDQKVNDEQRFTPNKMRTREEESNELGSIKAEEICGENETTHDEENLVEMEDRKFLVNEEVQIKTDEDDFNRFENCNVLPQSDVSLRLRGREKCLTSVIEEDPSEPHIKCKSTLMNENDIHIPSKIIMYNCDSCSFQTASEHDLKYHLLKHKDPQIKMYKCESCFYQTKEESNLTMHNLIHQVEPMYECVSCSYQTKYEDYFKKHLIKHTEVTTYKCDSCNFETENKGVFRRHLLMHKDPSEVTMFKCDSCSYQTKCKHLLKPHYLRVHKDPSQVTKYKCDFCSFQTASKSYLYTHSLKHKDPSEVTMYKCANCSFQTKYRGSLKLHLKYHNDPLGGTSGITMHKCDSCSFQTKYKFYLKTHLLHHKDPSEVTIYKCASCSFQTRIKYSYTVHLLEHKDPSEITYICNFCSYETKFKRRLKRHLVVHKKLSEVTVYKCDTCSFQTKHKNSLKIHLLRHKDPSEIVMYKCASCSFQTKSKRYLVRHMLAHKNSQK